MNYQVRKDFNQIEHSELLPRRSFIRNAALGIAGASVTFVCADATLAGAKDSGEVVLDGLMWTYVAAPLGTAAGSHFLTPGLGYSITCGLSSQANQEISLRANIPAGEEAIGGNVSQSQSTKLPHAITLFPRAQRNESFSIGSVGGARENTTFFGICRPVLRFKGNGKKAQFRLLDAECIFSTSAGQLASELQNFVSIETANSWISQYITDAALLVEPRFVLLATVSGGRHEFTMRPSSDTPDVSATVTVRVLDQSGFNSDVMKQAFAVGNDLAVTYFSAQDSGGKLLTSQVDLGGGPGINSIYWDRVFKTFLISQ